MKPVYNFSITMPKKRRKLSKDMEKEIKLAIKKVEFISAIINDIEDEEIQGEYRGEFGNIKNALVILSVEYDTNGFTPVSEKALLNYKNLVSQFESEYEI